MSCTALQRFAPHCPERVDLWRMTQCILDDLRHDSGTGMRHDRGSMISFAE
jgi:hypothetical protein